MPTGRRTLVALFLALSLAGPGAAEAQLRADSATLHPPRDEIRWAGPTAAAAGVALAGTFVLDEAIRQGWTGEPGYADWEWLSDRLNPLGKPHYSVVGLGALYVAGRAAGSRTLSDGAWHSLAALAASGIANGTLKAGIGRARPHRERGNRDFDHFTMEDHWQSFPSGHTTVAFSLATALAVEADRPWVTVLGYGTAALVGWSRIYEDKHWASDVVGGALVGTVASRLTLHWLHDREGAPVRVVASPAGIAVSVPTR